MRGAELLCERVGRSVGLGPSIVRVRPCVRACVGIIHVCACVATACSQRSLSKRAAVLPVARRALHGTKGALYGTLEYSSTALLQVARRALHGARGTLRVLYGYSSTVGPAGGSKGSAPCCNGSSTRTRSEARRTH